MNSLHDLGGMDGMGPLPFEVDEPMFHGEWERRILGAHLLTLMTGLVVADEARHSMERIPALHWLASPYYEHWLDGTETYLIEKGIVTADELANSTASEPLPDWAAKLPALDPDTVEGMMRTNHPVVGDAGSEPRYRVGDKVRTLNIHPKGHTRLPRYTRAKSCVIVAYRGACLFADDRADGKTGAVDHTYTVRFESQALWGPQGVARDAVYIDLYERYLEDV